MHAALVAAQFCRDPLRKVSVCAAIRLLSAWLSDLPWMKNMTSRVGGTGCCAHVPSAPGVSWWKGTSCQRQLHSGSGMRALSECSCGLDNVLTAGARHRHRPSLILILALLSRLGHSRIIPSSPQNVEHSADSLEFSGQDIQPLSWIMDICEGGAAHQPLNPLHRGTAGGSSCSHCSQLQEQPGD